MGLEVDWSERQKMKALGETNMSLAGVGWVTSLIG
jgi:hypothetical protein